MTGAAGPMMQCLKASVVIFSGLKIDKLDDLSAIIDRGAVRLVIAAGSLAMALKKADAQLAGNDFCLGLAEDPSKREEPYYIPASRVERWSFSCACSSRSRASICAVVATALLRTNSHAISAPSAAPLRAAMMSGR